ncbi:hypothetical protein LRR81_01935 [Metabacillus sp. GX 13764]|uniref:hypothetical protein n=1 Tax=Metabacillus kandeliae TaxID=2900151 RepID=UPI001E2E4B66|nr:hypothetical protein [Metabacillus kandeliae]MCD7032972.1 hypothetical protein [Metabacillus kandeliae]
MAMAALGLLIDRMEAERRWEHNENVFSYFLQELLEQKGIPYSLVESVEENLEDYDLLICGLAENSEDACFKLAAYAGNGGSLINFSDSEKLAALFQCKVENACKGYAFLPDFFEQPVPLRYLRGNIWRREEPSAMAEGELKAEKPDGELKGSVLEKLPFGRGTLWHWNVDIPSTIVLLQQGLKPVTEDGIPAPDGTADIDEGLLKADDGFALDWETDRFLTPSGMPYFAHPYADYWREALYRNLFHAAADKGLSLPFVSQWPDGTSHVAIISHDSDGNSDEAALETAAVLKAAGVKTTWCMLEPGYSGQIYSLLKKEGHEIAFHYNALEAEQGVWGREAFRTQLYWLKKAAGILRAVSNKNHYTLFEGWSSLYSWCDETGIELDQSRGPSKKGNIGFLFGTCFPYRPIDWHTGQNRLFHVLELGFLTQDLNHHALADTTVIAPFLKTVRHLGGAAHFLFHQNHIYEQPAVKEAIKEVIQKAKEEGFEFWTSEKINSWERKKRSISIHAVTHDFQPLAENTEEAGGAVIYTPLPYGCADKGLALEKKYGLPCIRTVLMENKAQSI